MIVTGECDVPAGDQRVENNLTLSWGGSENDDFELTFYFFKVLNFFLRLLVTLHFSYKS